MKKSSVAAANLKDFSRSSRNPEFSLMVREMYIDFRGRGIPGRSQGIQMLRHGKRLLALILSIIILYQIGIAGTHNHLAESYIHRPGEFAEDASRVQDSSHCIECELLARLGTRLFVSPIYFPCVMTCLASFHTSAGAIQETVYRSCHVPRGPPISA